MRRIIILWHILFLPLLGYGQICGVTDTTVLPSFQTEAIDIIIQPGDLQNENLADPNQGLCGIEINFQHGFVEDLELSLIGPDGTQVQLTGPTITTTTGSFTPAARWVIRFVANSITAEPDPGFTAQWNNNQTTNFIAGGQYSGSYYPFIGSLDDFNTGSIVGTWTLVGNNTAGFNPGRINGVRLIFCDETGLDCCFADAGTLGDEDLLSCIGDDTLNYVPNLVYTRPRPDTNEFGYTYLISQDSILLRYEEEIVDLTDLPLGSYQVCGLSYALADAGSLPALGTNLNDIFADLTSPNPSFCAELTADCREIIIQTPPVPVDSLARICEGDAFIFQDSALTQAGTYPFTLISEAGCDSIVNIILSVEPTITTTIDSTICEGETVQIGASIYDASGIYQDTFPSSTNCDSVVALESGSDPQSRHHY